MNHNFNAPRIERSSRKVVHQNRFVTVSDDEVTFPDANTGTYTTVTSGNGFGAVIIVRARTKVGPKYALVTQHRYPIDKATLEFARGGTEDFSANEAIREVIEETGAGEGLTPIRIGTIHPDTGLLTTEIGVWVLTVPSVPPEEHTDTETGGGVIWVGEGELHGLIQNGKVTCGITLAAYVTLVTSSHHILPDM